MKEFYEGLANSTESLKQGKVRCETCGREESVSSAKCLQYGWPECHGATMTLMSAEGEADARCLPDIAGRGDRRCKEDPTGRNQRMMTRAEHLDWSKKRALEYVDRGDLAQAMASMGSDLSKHPELEKHSAIRLGVMLMLGGQLNSPEKMRKFIEGFH